MEGAGQSWERSGERQRMIRNPHFKQLVMSIGQHLLRHLWMLSSGILPSSWVLSLSRPCRNPHFWEVSEDRPLLNSLTVWTKPRLALCLKPYDSSAPTGPTWPEMVGGSQWKQRLYRGVACCPGSGWDANRDAHCMWLQDPHSETLWEETSEGDREELPSITALQNLAGDTRGRRWK